MRCKGAASGGALLADIRAATQRGQGRQRDAQAERWVTLRGTDETLAAYRPEIESFLTKTLGHADFSIEHGADKRARFGVDVSAGKPFDLDVIAAMVKASA